MKRFRISPMLFIFLTIFIDFMGGSIIIPILPYIVERYRPDAFTVGFLEASFFLALFITAPTLGAISDRFGRRPVLLWCTFGTAISYALFGLANTLELLFFARITGGFTGGVLSTAQAYIADISKKEDFAKNFGILGAAFGLGFVLGPAIGGVLVQVNLNLPMLAAAGLALLNFILGYFTLPESLSASRRHPLALKEFNPLTQLENLASNSKVRDLVVAFFVFNFAFAGFQTNIAVLTRDHFDWSAGENALLFVYIGLVSSLVQGGLIRVLLARFSEERLALFGLGLAGLSMGSIALVAHETWLYLAVGVFAGGVGICLPTLRGLISARASAQEQGRVIGSTQALVSLAMVLGPLWAGFTFDHIGFAAPYWTGALWIMASLKMTTTALRMGYSSVR